MKKILYTILFLALGIFAITKSASATELVVGSTTIPWTERILSNINSISNPVFVKTFTATASGFLTKTEIQAYGSGSSAVNYYAIVDECNSSPCATQATYINTTSTSVYVWPLSGTNTGYQNFNGRFDITQGKEYRIRFFSDNTCSSGCGDVYAGQYLVPGDPDFLIYADTDYPAPTETGSIDFIGPLNGRTYAQTFGYFTASTTYGNAYQSGNNVNISLALSTSSLPIHPFQTPDAYLFTTVPAKFGPGVITQIPIKKNLFINGTSTHWYAYLLLYNSDFTQLVDTASIQFNISADINYGQQTPLERLLLEEDNCSIYDGGLFSSSTLNGISCYGSNFFKKLYNTGVIIANKAVSTAGYILTHTFPISVFYTVNSDFQTAIDNATSSKDIILESAHPEVFGGRSYSIITSSTMDTVSQNIGFDYKTILDYVLYAFTGGLMLFTSIKIIGKLHHKVGSSSIQTK